jgi:branched-chain amino acid transport system ATP-binding protein
MLDVTDLSVYYGRIRALDGISLTVEEGELVTVIGANGAGKTTLVKAIMGLLPPKTGRIKFNGVELSSVPPWERSLHRIAYVPEGSRVFRDLSVKENIRMGAFCRKDNDIDSDIEGLYGVFPVLKERERQLAGTLSGGEQQILAIARSLISKPKLLLIDEMSLGLMPLLVSMLFKLIKDLCQKEMAILLIEQNARKALEIAARGYLIENGRIVLEGNTSDLLMDEKVKAAYLGG